MSRRMRQDDPFGIPAWVIPLALVIVCAMGAIGAGFFG